MDVVGARQRVCYVDKALREFDNFGNIARAVAGRELSQKSVQTTN